MRVRRAAVLWLFAWCGPLMVAGSAFLPSLVGGGVVRDEVGNASIENVYPNVVFGALVPLLGALILSRVPRHAVGRLFIACGLASAVTLTAYPLAEVGYSRGLGFGVAAAWVSEWVWGLGLIPLVTLGVLLFPDGRPPGPRWRVLVLSDTVAVVLVFLANAFHPGRLQNHPAIVNPLGIDLPSPVFGTLMAAGMALFFVGFVGGAAAAVLRWRSAGASERAQLGWFAISVAVLPAVLLPPIPAAVKATLMVVALPLVPFSVAVAILRRHLYGIEVVVRRSLLYGALTTVLLVVYAFVVTGLGYVFRGRGGEAAALVATGLVAIGFAPLRARLQRAVDRMLYGDRGDPYTVVTSLGRTLAGSGADPLSEAAATVAGVLRLPYVRVEVELEGTAPLVGADGAPVTNVQELALTFGGERLGRLVLAPRSPLDPFRPAELRLLDDLARQMAAVAYAVRLANDLQHSREALVNAREEERRRLRRDLHDGLGPALAGIALGLEAVHRLASSDSGETAELAMQLRDEVRASLADVRRLVEDLRPPALDRLGLVGAVRQQARLLTERDPGLEVHVQAVGMGELPAAVEVAAYRITTEALTNVSRHAAARHCRVDLSQEHDGFVELTIEDDGVGLAEDRHHGVGLTAMHERAAELGGSCQAGPAPFGGTRISVRLPVPA